MSKKRPLQEPIDFDQIRDKTRQALRKKPKNRSFKRARRRMKRDLPKFY